MTFKESVITCIQYKYADFKGRASRSEYWWFLLFSFLVGIGCQALDYFLFGDSNGLIRLVASLALLIPSLAVTIRRMHDYGLRGWWLLGSVAILTLLAAFIISPETQAGEMILNIAVLTLLVINGTIKSDSSNKYGEPPAT